MMNIIQSVYLQLFHQILCNNLVNLNGASSLWLKPSSGNGWRMLKTTSPPYLHIFLLTRILGHYHLSKFFNNEPWKSCLHFANVSYGEWPALHVDSPFWLPVGQTWSQPSLWVTDYPPWGPWTMPFAPLECFKTYNPGHFALNEMRNALVAIFWRHRAAPCHVSLSATGMV